MPDDFAFDIEKCDVDPVTRIPPCDTLLTDPRVTEAPPPIVDCPEEPLELPPGSPCPNIEPDESHPELLKLIYGNTPELNPPSLVYFFRKTPCCDFELDIQLNIPCPTLLPETVTKPIPWIPDPTELVFGFVQDLETCSFTLDINLSLHCPALTPTTATTVTFDVGTLTYSFTKDSDACDYSLSIAVDIPPTGLYTCPDITPIVEETAFIGFAAGPQGSVTYVFTKDAEACTYDLTITIEAPCPAITPSYSDGLSYVTFADGPQGVLQFGFVVGADCDYALLITLDAPCPDITPVGTPVYIYGYSSGGTQTYLSYYFVKGTDCDYTLSIDFVLACPVVLPTTETFAYFDGAGGAQGWVSYYFTKDATDCTYALTLDVEMPCPCMCVPVINVSTTVLTAGASPTVSVSGSAESCTQTLTFQFFLPAPGGGGAQGGYSIRNSDSTLAYVSPKPVVLPSERPTTVQDLRLAYPTYSPQAYIFDQIEIVQDIPVGPAVKLTRSIPDDFLSLCAANSVRVVTILCDRPAVTGGQVQGNTVHAEISAVVGTVTRTLISVSGIQANRVSRYRRPSDAEMAVLETMLEGGLSDFAVS